MNGELAQLVALVTYGQAFLSSRGDAPELFGNHSAFKSVRRLSIHAPPPPDVRKTQPIYSRTAPWLQSLADRAVASLSAIIFKGGQPLPDHISVAFVGGGRWGIQAVAPTFADAYAPHWSLLPGDPDPKAPWAVVYSYVPLEGPLQLISEPQITIRLARAIEECRQIAAVGDLPSWQGLFTKALALLEASPSTIPHFPDMVPAEHLASEDRQLLAAASAAWVFGGMGSWNDLGFPDSALNERYERASAALYDAVVDAIFTVANRGAA